MSVNQRGRARTALARSVLLLLVALPAARGARGQGVSPRQIQADGTRRMSERLEKIGKRLEAVRLSYTGLADPGMLRYFWQIRQPLDLRGELIVEARTAYELLLQGRNREAARRLEQVKKSAAANVALFDPPFLKNVRELLAVSYLRAGQQENDSAREGTAPALLTVASPRAHVANEETEAAVKEYLEILRADPDDATSRWLLNLAYMSLGEYPGEVPKPWLIPPSVFKSEYDMGRFEDAAPRLRLDVSALAGGSVTEDFDGDGYLDIMTSSLGLDRERDQLRYFRNNGDGTFADRTAAAGLAGITGGLQISSADYNNDGCVDVFIPRGAWLGSIGHHPPSLLRNNCDGTFTDVTEEAGLLTLHPSQAAAWGDFDNDGRVDLFVGNESMPTYRALSINIELASSPSVKNPIYFFDYQDLNPCQLFRNNGDGTFTEVAKQVGLGLLGWVKGAAWGDYNNDGLPDLYVSRLGEPNLLMRNDGRDASGGWKFTDVTEQAGVGEPIQSYACWFWDYDNDGWLDLFVAGYSIEDFAHQAGQVAADYLGRPFTAETPRLYRNNRDGSFKDVTREAGLHHALFSMGGNYGDLDNDGYPDIYLGTGGLDYRALLPNRMFRNEAGRHFQDVTDSAGVGYLQKGQAVSFGDVDNDGDQDIYAVFGGVYPGDAFRRALFLNPAHGNHWLKLRLEGVRSNRAAIGARIKVSVDVKSGRRDIYSAVSTGGSFGTSSLQQVVGLGRATSVRSLEITWPATGKTQTFGGLRVDRSYVIREDDAAPVPVKLGKLNLYGEPRRAKPAPASR
ncbi:MAG: CRTAC1 family protein [Acidobacteria bacterium]|nr:CRTAC1 family protein [Acidobacteriota bacterium]